MIYLQVHGQLYRPTFRLARLAIDAIQMATQCCCQGALWRPHNDNVLCKVHCWLVQYLRHLHGLGHFSLAVQGSVVIDGMMCVELLCRFCSLDLHAGASAFCAGANCLYNGCRA